MTETDVEEILAQHAAAISFLVRRSRAEAALAGVLVAEVINGDPKKAALLRSAVETALRVAGEPLDDTQMDVLACLGEAVDDALDEAETGRPQ